MYFLYVSSLVSVFDAFCTTAWLRLLFSSSASIFSPLCIIRFMKKTLVITATASIARVIVNVAKRTLFRIGILFVFRFMSILLSDSM